MQFHLSTLFFATLVVATSIALMGGLGILAALYLIVLAVFFGRGIRGDRDSWQISLGMASIPAMFGLFAYFSETQLVSHPPGPRSQCLQNLKQLALAIQGYHSAKGSLPPASVTDRDGKPMHSWRVLTLPYMERMDLYRAYRFDEPWNGPGNRWLATMHNPNFVCPSDPDASASRVATTNYVAITGPGTVWDDYHFPIHPKQRLADDRRILLVEVAGSDISWTEPRDLTVEDLASGINSSSAPGVSSHHATLGAAAVLANGQLIYLPQSISPKLLGELATEGLDAAREAEINALPTETRYPNEHLGERILAWLVSILAYAVHTVLLSRKQRKRQQDASIQESDDRGP